MRVRHVLAAIGMCTLAVGSHAEDNHSAALSSLTQQNFRLLSEDLGAALSYHSITPPTSLGLSGFDPGFGLNTGRLTQPQIYRQATSSSEDMLYAPRVHLRKGLPFGFDVGASYGELPGSDLQLIGAEARYALIPRSAVLPTIGLRASYSALRGSESLDLTTRTVDLSLSRGFSLLTPYAGIGTIWVDSTPYKNAGLEREQFSHDKYFIGANVNLRLMNIAVEADRTGDTTSYHAKFGWRW